MAHCYPQGANLYFIFMTKMQDEEEFRAYHATILDAIQKSGAAISHHHGIGKMFAPWLEGYLGEKEYGIIRNVNHKHIKSRLSSHLKRKPFYCRSQKSLLFV